MDSTLAIDSDAVAKLRRDFLPPADSAYAVMKKLLPFEQQNNSEVMLRHDDIKRRSNDTNDGRRRIILWSNASIFVACICPFSLMDRYRLLV